MNLPPDQLKLRLEAALRTLERITTEHTLSEDAHMALCRAEWHVRRALSDLEHLRAHGG